MNRLKTIGLWIVNFLVTTGKLLFAVSPYLSIIFEMYLHGIKIFPIILFCFIIFLGIISSFEIQSKLERMVFIAYMYHALIIWLVIVIALINYIG